MVNKILQTSYLKSIDIRGEDNKKERLEMELNSCLIETSKDKNIISYQCIPYGNGIYYVFISYYEYVSKENNDVCDYVINNLHKVSKHEALKLYTILESYLDYKQSVDDFNK